MDEGRNTINELSESSGGASFAYLSHLENLISASPFELQSNLETQQEEPEISHP
jgi:hypothetical protein